MKRMAFIVAVSVLQGVLLFAPMVTSNASISLGTATLALVAPRIFTPNGDGFNDKASFSFENPDYLPVSGTIYDLSGCRVADLSGGSDSALQLLWDGKDANGQTVAGGIYVYQIQFQGKRATGTVVVAR